MAKRGKTRPGFGRPVPTRSAALVDAPSKHFQAARGLWNSGHRADALSLLAEAVRREPNNVQTYVMAARAYADAFEFEQMEGMHELLVRRAPRHPGVHHYIGETYTLLRLPEKALKSLQLAAELPGAGPPTWMELASLYERAHRLDEAEEMIERAVRAGYNRPTVSLVRGRIQRRQKRTEQAEATFCEITKSADASDFACKAWSEIALMKDEAGDFGGAVSAIENCKRIQRGQEKKHWTTAERLHAQSLTLSTDLTRDTLRRWRHETANLPARRVALLTGFPRSGTTLLEQMLDAHPALISSEERDFVGKELLQKYTAHRGTTPLLDALNERDLSGIECERGRYFKAMEYLLGESVGDRIHLDKNPSYNLVIPLMLRVFPETRLLIAVRDPRDVVLSCYLRYLPLNAVSVRFLDMQRTAEKYAFDMAAWLRLRETVEVPWCEIRYEDTIADSAGQVRKALATLGLEWDERVLDYRQRLTDTKRVSSPSYEAVAKPIYTKAVGRWKNYQRLLEPALETLEPFVREFGHRP